MSLVVKIEGNVVDPNKISKNSASISTDSQGRKSLGVGIYFTAAQGIPIEGHDIAILEDTTLLFGGVIGGISINPFTSHQSSSADLLCNITSDGYNSIPQRRTLTLNYTDKTAGFVVSDMITSFLSEEGVTAGTISTGATLTAYSGIYKSIKEVLDEMAEASGYAWNINDDLTLDFKAVETPTLSTDTITGDDGDHFNFRPTRSLNGFRNKQYVEGGLDAGGNVIRVVTQDDVSIAARQAAEGGSGVYGNVYKDTNIQTAENALVVAKELLDRYLVPAAASVQSYKSMDVGKIIKVTYPKYSIGANTEYLITSKTAERDGNQWVYSYNLEARSSTNFSSKPRSNAVDFFSKLLKKETVSDGGGGGTGINIYSFETLPVDLSGFIDGDIILI